MNRYHNNDVLYTPFGRFIYGYGYDWQGIVWSFHHRIQVNMALLELDIGPLYFDIEFQPKPKGGQDARQQRETGMQEVWGARNSP
jgi:hypothetical protein